MIMGFISSTGPLVVAIGSLLLTMLGAIGTAVVWAVRLEGKLAAHEAKDEKTQEATHYALLDIKTDLREIRNHLLSTPPPSRHDAQA